MADRFQTIGTMASRGGRPGFIHLLHTNKFDDGVRARYGRVVEAAIQAAVDGRRGTPGLASWHADCS